MKYPDPNRFYENIQEVIKLHPPSNSKSGSIVFIGSSSIRRWAENLAIDFKPFAVTPRGFGGSNLNDINFYFDELFKGLSPVAVVIYAGGHDIKHGASPPDVLTQLNIFKKNIFHQFPSVIIFYLSIKPVPKRFHLWPVCEEANSLIKSEFCNENNIHFVDVASCLIDSNGNPELINYIDDHIHLAPEGYRKWVSILKPVLMSRLKRR